MCSRSEPRWVPETLLPTAASEDPEVPGGGCRVPGVGTAQSPPSQTHALGPGCLTPVEQSLGLSAC